jgi:SAM-dependent methyltransferase
MDRDFWHKAYEEDPDGAVVTDFFLDNEVRDLKPGRALDLGCGTGLNALKLAEHGWSVVGVDWVESAIELAQQTASERSLDAEFIVADTTAWEPQFKFDLVITTYALPGGEMSRRVLQTALAALDCGGTLIVAEWDRSMSDVWGFEDDVLMTPREIALQLPGLDVEIAEVRRVEDAFPVPDDPRGKGGQAANVAFVRARRP